MKKIVLISIGALMLVSSVFADSKNTTEKSVAQKKVELEKAFFNRHKEHLLETIKKENEINKSFEKCLNKAKEKQDLRNCGIEKNKANNTKMEEQKNKLDRIFDKSHDIPSELKKK